MGGASASTRRAIVIAAVALIVSYLAGAIALGSVPDVNDSGADVAAYFAGHEGAVRFSSWTAIVSTLAFTVFAAIVRNVLPKPNADVFLIGAVAFVAESVILGWIWAGLALHTDSLDPATARTVFDVASYWGPMLTGATLAMIGAVTALGLRTPASIPRWLTVLGAIAFVEQAIETVTVFGTDGFIAPGGAMNNGLGAALTIIWFGGVVAWIARGGTALPARREA
jgi:hypothetical protein